MTNRVTCSCSRPIRDDLVANRQAGSLVALRDGFASEPPLKVYSQLTDLRLLDVLTWR